MDVGGTFTDLAAVAPDGRVETRKVLSTPSDQSEGVTASLEALQLGRKPNDALWFYRFHEFLAPSPDERNAARHCPASAPATSSVPSPSK